MTRDTEKIFAGPVKRDHHVLRAVSVDGKVHVEAWMEDHWKRTSYLLSDVLKGRVLTADEMEQYGISGADSAHDLHQHFGKEEAERAASKQRTDELASAMTRYLHYQSLKVAAANERDPVRRRQHEEEAARLRAEITKMEKSS